MYAPVTVAKASQRHAAIPLWHTMLLLAYMLFPLSILPGGKVLVSSLSEAGLIWKYLIDMYWLWLGLAIVLVGLSLRGISIPEFLGLNRAEKRDQIKNIYTAAATWLLTVALTLLTYFLFGPFEHGSHRLLPSSALEFMAFLPLSITAGLCEEVIFRGYFLQQLHARTGNVVLALCGQAAAFSLAHGYNQTIAGFGNRLAVGILFGIVAIRRRSIIPCIIAHIWLDFSAGLISVLFV